MSLSKASLEGLARLWECSPASYRASMLIYHDPVDVLQVLKILKIENIPKLLEGLREGVSKV